MPRTAALVVIGALVLAGCGAIAGATAGPPGAPEPCGQVYSADRCLAMTDYAAFELKTTREDIVSLEILPEPTPEVRDGQVIVRITSGGPDIEVGVTLADGSTHVASMHCIAASNHPACQDEPALQVSWMIGNGYTDVPEGSTPVPSVAPDALAEAMGLEIERLDISVEHTGLNEIKLGEALLPNGRLTTTEFALVDDWPAGISIIDGRVHLEIRSAVDGKPIWNIYEHGWREGTERVEAVLVFDVFHVDPGATLSIRDVVVR
jgi:hypothetical protein